MGLIENLPFQRLNQESRPEVTGVKNVLIVGDTVQNPAIQHADPTKSIHGVNVALQNISTALQRKGVATEFLTRDNFLTKFTLPLAEEYELPDITDDDYNELYEHFSKHRPDVMMIIPEGSLGIVMLMIAKELNIPSVAAYTTNLDEYLSKRVAQRFSFNNPWLEKKLEQVLHEPLANIVRSASHFIYSLADYVTVQTPAVKARVHNLLKIPEERIGEWTRGIDRGIFKRLNQLPYNPYERLVGYKKGDKMLLSVGRMVAEKSYNELIEYARMLWREGNPNRIHVVFAGPATDVDLEIIQNAESEMPGLFHYLGPKSQEELSILYNAADVFAIASKSDPLAFTPREALCCGLPVVSVHDQPTSLHVTEGLTGYTYTSGDLHSLDEAIINSLKLDRSDPRFMNSINQGEKKILSWDESADVLLRLLNQVAQRTIRRRAA